jgi:DNA-binding Lrp family transcriptional regulator
MVKEPLSDRQKIILQHAQFFYHEGPEKIASMTGIPAHQVRYDLKNLFDRGILLRQRKINLLRLGYYVFHIHLYVKSQDVGRLLKVLKESSRVLYLSLNGGERTVGVTILSRAPELIFELMDEAAAKSKAAFAQVGWSVEGAFYYFGPKFLTGRTLNNPAINSNWGDGPISIDRIDAEILKLFNRGEAQNASEVARALGAPASTVQYRIKQLENKGVILPVSAFALLLNLGYSEFEVLVQTSQGSQSEHQRFIQYCQEHLSITLLIRSFGDWQYKLVTLVERSSEVFQIEDELLKRFSDLIQKVTIIARREIIKGGDFPVEDFD